ncbi:MAG TPA: methyltransferase domain-containing protein [bacterium]|nr:methyltransferase domain-containing protein [bacterium]
MQIVLGNKQKEICEADFGELIKNSKAKKIEIDLGTGDGRFVYKNAQKNRDTFYIGIDPIEKQLQKYSKKVIRKKLTNALFVISSVECLPKELENTANTVNIFLPWGSLLNYVANCNKDVIKNVKNLLFSNGEINILFGYAHQTEPTETERLDLEKLNESYIKEILIPNYEKLSLVCKKMEEISMEKLKKFETSWSKKLSFGKERPMFFLKFQVEAQKPD